MRKYQLRTYRLRTKETAVAYLPHWVLHIESLKSFGVETHGFVSVPATPQKRRCAHQLRRECRPEAITQQYMQSDGLKTDMAGFDGSQMEGVETLLLIPGGGSPLT